MLNPSSALAMTLRYKVVARLENGHNKGVTYIAFSPNGSFLASGSLDSRVCIWNLFSESYDLMHVLTGTSAILSVVWTSVDILLCGLQNGTITGFVLGTVSGECFDSYCLHRY